VLDVTPFVVFGYERP